MDPVQRLVAHPLFEQRESEYIRWYPKTLTKPLATPLPSRIAADGIYIHIPFCDKLCSFCPYNKIVSDHSVMTEFVQALCKEIEMYARMSTEHAVRFVYFGGGTPSVLDPQDVERILTTLRNGFNLIPSAEISFEAHPTHLTANYVHQLRELGVTRISSGIQQLDDHLLSTLGSHHSADDGFEAIENTVKVMGHIAVDMLFRCPTQSLETWVDQLKLVTSMQGVSHVSCYSLVLKDPSNQPSKRTEAAMTIAMDQILTQRGYTHYASCASGGFDYALEGHRCQYEFSHWAAPQAEFLGLGPGAFGYVAGAMTGNGLHVRNYIKNINAGMLPLVSVTPVSSLDEQLRRYMILGVKTLKVDLAAIQRVSGVDPTRYFAKEIRWLEDMHFANVAENWLVLTDVGRYFVDTISAAFFSAAERDVPHPEEPELRQMEVEAIRNLTAKGGV
ncbi:MAG: hypothetical protein C7B47_16450 [Sulfobacillus thermosulfidooxidans]|uniref:Heme chaperone HemW n=1 Tax=Sulfobacillus thermosulfidooxidans TaxID=28034 RepID=A0A2T2WKB3_SULTH|nr:MAG: hypothetical protein C7B47_16450 [Sulfobacillus thermosulfidooxidans]